MFKLGTVSVPGQDKNGDQKQNQDCALDFSDGDVAVIVVCDGAGSKTFGGVGSNYLCRVIIRYLRLTKPSDHAIFRKTIERAIDSFRRIIERLCRQKNLKVTLEDFACTMMVCFRQMCPDRTLNYCAHLGDGAIFYLDSAFESAEFVSLPENGEYANQTYFVTDKNWCDHLRIPSLPDGAFNLILMTDGVTPMALKNNEPFFDFVRPLMLFLNNSSSQEGSQSLAKMLGSKKSMAISADDKSVGWLIN
tara:strand:- start:2159 stop:2902 length:744 start_codon:yes stop_codon:yes gene_type:complete